MTALLADAFALQQQRARLAEARDLAEVALEDVIRRIESETHQPVSLRPTHMVYDKRQVAANLWCVLQNHGVSPSIIERVLRLNPDYTPGRRLRGIHRSTDERDHMCLQRGFVTKGWVIRRYGREGFDKLPRGLWSAERCGKRLYVSREAVRDILG